MKKIGVLLIVAAIVLGILSDYLPKGFPIEPVVALSFAYFLLGMTLLILKSGEFRFMRKIPSPPEHLRPKKNGSVPRMRNPPAPPIKEGNCYLDCGDTYPSPGPDVICLNCGSSIKRPEFPKDRIE